MVIDLVAPRADAAPVGLAALLAAARADDAAAWEALVARIHRLLLHAAGRIAPALAEDAAQEALLRLPELLDGFRCGNDRQATAWLCSIAAHCARNLRRAEEARLRHERQAGREAITDRHARRQHDGPDQLLAALPALIASLGERDRQVIRWRYLESLAPDEIAARLGVPASHAAVILHRALGRLRERCARRGLAVGAAVLLLALRRLDAAHAQPEAPSASPRRTGCALVPATLLLTWAVWTGSATPATLPEAAQRADTAEPAAPQLPQATGATAASAWAGLTRGAQSTGMRRLVLPLLGQHGTHTDEDGRTWRLAGDGRGHLQLGPLPSWCWDDLAQVGDGGGLELTLRVPMGARLPTPNLRMAIGHAGAMPPLIAHLGGTQRPDGAETRVVLDILRIPDDPTGSPRFAVALRVGSLHGVHAEQVVQGHPSTWQMIWDTAAWLRVDAVTWTRLQPRPRGQASAAQPRSNRRHHF